MDKPAILRPLCLAAAVLGLLAGASGLLASLTFLTFNTAADVIAGASGLIAGAILFGSGLLALTALATQPTAGSPKKFGDPPLG